MSDDKREKARLRVALWRAANPERSKSAIEKAKAADPEKYKELQRKWAENHIEYKRNQVKTWREMNRQRSNKFSAKWRMNNPEARKRVVNAWRNRNPEKLNAAYARRRASKLHAIPAWANRFFVDEIYHLARLRTKVMGFQWHVDHIVPLQSKLVCGLHVENNLQVIPSERNQSKNNRYWPEMP